jgi:hypothetical protein
MRLLISALVAIGLVAQGASSGSQPAGGLQGVWQTVTVRIGGANPREISIARPAAYLTIFTSRHYSRTEIQSDGPRPILADASKATADELRAVWGPVVAEAGTYEVRGDTITLHPQASKSPAAMAPGAFIICSFELDGAMLTIAQQRNQAGPYPNPVTFTLKRLER